MRRTVVAVAIAGASITLALAFALPIFSVRFALPLPAWLPEAFALRLRSGLIEAGRIPVGEHYLFGVVRDLFAQGELLLACALMLFSIVFPSAKLVLVLRMFLARRPNPALRRILAFAGKWSMTEVFVVALLLVFIKADGFHLRASAGPGVLWLAASAVLSSVAVSLLSSPATGQVAGSPGDR